MGQDDMSIGVSRVASSDTDVTISFKGSHPSVVENYIGRVVKTLGKEAQGAIKVSDATIKDAKGDCSIDVTVDKSLKGRIKKECPEVVDKVIASLTSSQSQDAKHYFSDLRDEVSGEERTKFWQEQIDFWQKD